MQERFNYGCFAVIHQPAERTMHKTPRKFRIPEFVEKLKQNVKSSYHSGRYIMKVGHFARSGQRALIPTQTCNVTF